MSKASSGLFSGTIGANRAKVAILRPMKASAQAPLSIAPESIRFSQTSVNGVEVIVESMKKDGWKGDPIDVVTMPDGAMTTLDNTRVVAATMAGIDVKARVHAYNDPLPNQETKTRFTTKKDGEPATWGQAVEYRIHKQSSAFRKTYPCGSYNMAHVK